MEILPVPALSDNFMYLVVDVPTKKCAVVDPVEPKKLMDIIKDRGLELTSALITHHHWDHAGGNKAFRQLIPENLSVEILGGDKRIDELTRLVQHDDTHSIGSLNVQCLFTPCHTTGHICYYVTGPSAEPGAVFTGDTLFLGGCGRFFEGTADQMYQALVTILGNLPGETRVYCGHEYAIRNLRFDVSVEPNNSDSSDKLEWAEKMISAGKHSVPSTIAEEKKYNVFMRVEEASLQQKLKGKDGVDTMRILRSMKDKF